MIYEDFCKIKRQLFGQENIFGYQSTFANQLYIFYCILGIERYFTDKFHPLTKFVFFIWHFSGLVTPLIILSGYIFFFEKNDFMLLLLVCFTIGSFIFSRICVPYMLFRYENDFKQIINDVDAIMLNRGSNFTQLKNTIDIKMMALSNMAIFLGFQAGFTLICSIDIGLFYKEEKLKHYAFYAIPLPKLEQYGNLQIFLLVNLSAFVGVMIISLELCALMGIPMLLSAICHNEVLHICDSLDQHSNRFIAVAEDDSIMQQKFRDAITLFENDLIKGINCYQRVTRIIRYFKEFYTTLCSVTLLAIYIFSVCHAYAILTMKGAFVLKLKEILVSFSTAHMTYHMCKVGDIFDELTTTMSFQVYSMPWYCSTVIRKNVCIFLTQSQRQVNLKAAKVYPLLLSAFLRLLNSVYSTVSVLRRVIK